MNTIDDFLDAVRRQLQHNRLRHTIWWSLLVLAAILLVIGGGHLLSGHRLPVWWYPVLVLATAVVALIVVWIHRPDRRQVARTADRAFALDDHLVTACGQVVGHHDPRLVALQRQQAEQRIQRCDPRDLARRPQAHIRWGAGLALVAAVGIGFVPDSATVVAEKTERQRVQSDTAAIADLLQERVDELLRETDDEDLLDVDPNEWREWVSELEAQEEQLSALRQYARLDQNLAQQEQALQTRAQEQLLSEAGQELMGSAETRALGQQLMNQDFAGAREALAAMKTDAEMSQQNLEAQQQRADQLRAAADRMAQAAQRHQARNQQQGTAEDSQKNQSRSADRQSADRLAQQMQDLQKASKEYQESLQQARKECRRQGSCSQKTQGRCNQASQAVSQQLSQLGQSLKRMQASSQCRSRIAGLRKTLGQCRSGLCQGQGQGQTDQQWLADMLQQQQRGIGSGAGQEQQALAAQAPSTGVAEQVDLQQSGSGPSQTTVEEAAHGTGVSGRRATAGAQDFTHQFESFVQREDVPEDLRQGVRSYFELIHEGE